MPSMVIIWLIAVVAFSVIEMITPQLVSIWFAGGSLVALILELLGVPTWAQMVAFVLISIALVAITRPLYRKYVKKRIIPTNADSLIGKTAIVTVAIDNIHSVGQVKVGGQIWSALSDDGNTVDEGERVKIMEIRGVRLIISKII